MPAHILDDEMWAIMTEAIVSSITPRKCPPIRVKKMKKKTRKKKMDGEVSRSTEVSTSWAHKNNIAPRH